MTLANEAAYLYVHSKELLSLNKELRNLTNKAQKHVEKHNKSKTEEDRYKHRRKHGKTTEEIQKIIKKHNTTLQKLKSHQIAFAHALQKEHRSLV